MDICTLFSANLCVFKQKRLIDNLVFSNKRGVYKGCVLRFFNAITGVNKQHFLTTIYCHPLFAPKPVEFNGKGKKILDFCRQPKSSREIMDHIGVSYHSKNIATYIVKLIDTGYLYYTNPENINHMKQKYFTVEDKEVSEHLAF